MIYPLYSLQDFFPRLVLFNLLVSILISISLKVSNTYLLRVSISIDFSRTFLFRFFRVLAKASFSVYTSSLWKQLSGEPAKALAIVWSGERLNSVVWRTTRNNNRNVCERKMVVSHLGILTISLLYIEYTKSRVFFLTAFWHFTFLKFLKNQN